MGGRTPAPVVLRQVARSRHARQVGMRLCLAGREEGQGCGGCECGLCVGCLHQRLLQEERDAVECHGRVQPPRRGAGVRRAPPGRSGIGMTVSTSRGVLVRPGRRARSRVRVHETNQAACDRRHFDTVQSLETRCGRPCATPVRMPDALNGRHACGRRSTSVQLRRRVWFQGTCTVRCYSVHSPGLTEVLLRDVGRCSDTGY